MKLRIAVVALLLVAATVPVLADAILPAFLLGGPVAFLAALIGVISIEGLIIARYYLWRTKWQALWWAFIVNLATTLFGFVAMFDITWYIQSVYWPGGIQWSTHEGLTLVITVVAAYAISGLLEFLLLLFLQRKGPKLSTLSVFKISMLMNLTSYVAMSVIFVSVWLILLTIAIH